MTHWLPVLWCSECFATIAQQPGSLPMRLAAVRRKYVGDDLFSPSVFLIY